MDKDMREAYKEKLDAQLKEWKAKIDQLESRLASASSDVKRELTKEIHELRGQKEVLREKWNELQKSKDDAWDKMKDGLEKGAGELKETLDKVMARFR